MNRKNKSFDRVEMKRRIQERVYEETKGMNHQEFVEHIRRRIAESRFASFLERPIRQSSYTR